MHSCSVILWYDGYGPGTKDQIPKAAGPGPGGPQLLGLGHGSRVCIKHDQQAINKQYIIGDVG